MGVAGRVRDGAARTRMAAGADPVAWRAPGALESHFSACRALFVFLGVQGKALEREPQNARAPRDDGFGARQG